MSQRKKCHICGTRTVNGELCLVTTLKKSKCRPDLAAPGEDKEAFVCCGCIYMVQVVGHVCGRYMEEQDLEMEP